MAWVPAGGRTTARPGVRARPPGPGGRLLLVAVLVLLAGLAGCVGDEPLETPAGPNGDGGPTDAQNETSEDAVLAGIAAPTWAPGHYWRYDTSFDTELTLVVSGEAGEEWLVDTTSPETAWFHARSEISYLGAIRKSDLAGSQGDDRVQHLAFPLEEGKTWSTRWDGVEREVRVAETGRTFRLEAHEGDRLAVEYIYDPTVGWFREVVFHDADGLQFSMTLQEHRTGWSGEIVRWESESILQWESSGPAQSVSATFVVPDGVTDIWIELHWACQDQAAGFVLGLTPYNPPDVASGYGLIGDCGDLDETILIEEPLAAEWLLGIQVASVPEEAQLQVDAWQRTLVTLTAPM